MTKDLQQGDCLELLKTLKDNSIDIVFCDPPYALGSEVIIKPDGKPEYKKAVDFMNKWNQPDGTFWEEWFIEAKRVLKHGGHCLMFGMDRQLWFNCYYANLSGFTQKQSLYWYFISNFPKASDLSKMIDKNAGAEREVVGTQKVPNIKGDAFSVQNDKQKSSYENIEHNITAPSTPLAKKYSGYKYSIAPLKQTNETIMVFQKPYKTGSCLHDVLAMEDGDDTITCGGVDIDGNRVEAGKEITERKSIAGGGNGDVQFSGLKVKIYEGSINGRFPAQTYIDSFASEIIDLQSGKLKTHGGGKALNFKGVFGNGRKITDPEGLDKFKNDSGGASRILHCCDFDAGDYDLYYYCPKVSKSERNEGLEGFEEKSNMRVNAPRLNELEKHQTLLANNHPTVKPKALLSKILKLFKTPNDQVLLDPFMGSGSMGISAVETGFDYIGYELDKDYFEIAKRRIEVAENKINERIL